MGGSLGWVGNRAGGNNWVLSPASESGRIPILCSVGNLPVRAALIRRALTQLKFPVSWETLGVEAASYRYQANSAEIITSKTHAPIGPLMGLTKTNFPE